MPSRRELLRLTGLTLSLGTTGCLGSFRDGGVSIRAENRDDRRHTVGVTFESGEETVFGDEYTVPSGEETTAADVVAAGEYLVTVELDSTDPTRVDFTMGGCDSNTLFVSIQPGGEFEASVLDEC